MKSSASEPGLNVAGEFSLCKLFSLYKCFLAFFSISKIKHALPYVTDAFIVPNPYKQIGCCFMALQVALCIAKIRLTSECMYACSYRRAFPFA